MTTAMTWELLGATASGVLTVVVVSGLSQQLGLSYAEGSLASVSGWVLGWRSAQRLSSVFPDTQTRFGDRSNDRAPFNEARTACQPFRGWLDNRNRATGDWE